MRSDRSTSQPISHRVLRIVSLLVFGILLVAPVIVVEGYVRAYAPPDVSRSSSATLARVPDDIALDPRLPIQSVTQQSRFTNVNAAFGSRFNFSITPATASVASGTDGTFHENSASYSVGIAPTDKHQTYLFRMGRLNQQGDIYLANQTLTQGLSTTRWQGDAPDQGMHVTLNIISPFSGEPRCTEIVRCARAVADDTLPLLIIGVRLQNMSDVSHSGSFLFTSNRAPATPDSCIEEQTPTKTPVTLFSYDSSADATGGALFLAGTQQMWSCQKTTDRAGLSWAYSIPAGQSRSAYMLIGGWNATQNLFVNTQLPAGCQNEALYATHEWSSEQDVVNFALDNLSNGDNLLGQAQQTENQLISDNILAPEQRWLLGETLRSYKANTWLLARPACASNGNIASYDAAVYEGTYGLLSTVDVLHDYGYFEITHVPWFFRAEMTTVLQNATHDTYGTYFQHDQGGDVTSNGQCTDPGTGTPTIRSACYAPPYIAIGTPMPTEENADVALLLAYYAKTTGDQPFITQHIDQLNAAMSHNLLVGNPQTGIAYAGQDTATTYDAASDCLHNTGQDAGNQYYLGLKEATAYRATAYLDGLVSSNAYRIHWSNAATKIEQAMVQEYKIKGYLPLADSTAFSNCSGRSVTLGEGLFYLHMSGLDQTMNQVLLSDLASQYLTDLFQSQLASATTPEAIMMTSTAATGSQCAAGHCRRYEWFSKAILSTLVADMVYTNHGCTACRRINLSQAAYIHNIDLSNNFDDGIHADGSNWNGYLYPRGIICWAYLSPMY